MKDRFARLNMAIIYYMLNLYLSCIDTSDSRTRYHYHDHTLTNGQGCPDPHTNSLAREEYLEFMEHSPSEGKRDIRELSGTITGTSTQTEPCLSIDRWDIVFGGAFSLMSVGGAWASLSEMNRGSSRGVRRTKNFPPRTAYG